MNFIDKNKFNKFIEKTDKVILYTTREILDNKLLLSKKLTPMNKNELFRVIRSGELKALSVPGKYNEIEYKIKGSEIQRFLNERFKEIL